MIIEIIKKLKLEYIRKEEVKHKEEGNITKLDEKAVLLNLKKEEEEVEKEKINTHSSLNEYAAANISTSTGIVLHSSEVISNNTNNNLISLPTPDTEKGK